MKSAAIYYQLTVALARAQRADYNEIPEDEARELDYIKETVSDMLARLVAPKPDEQFISPQDDRPEGWMTVVEYMAEKRHGQLEFMSDVAAETSYYGVKASRLAKHAGITPVSVTKPPIFADDDHFTTVKAYPFYILELAIG